MNTLPWKGAGRRLSPHAFAAAAARLHAGMEPAAIEAVWQVECGARPFRPDGTLERRFEPHHMPGSGMTWKQSLALPPAKREQQFAVAWRGHPEAALRATSWGGPQIMGFNCKDAGFDTAREMVLAMAADEQAQLDAFVTLVKAWKLESALYSRDWKRFAARWNGAGKAADYAAKIESAYREIAGRASPQVLSIDRRNDPAAVRELQRVLGVEVDGSFGPATDRAVRAYQERAGLHPDGIVGARTWERLRGSREAAPPVQPTETDRAALIGAYASAGTAGAGALTAIGDALPENAVTILAAGAVLAGLLALAAWLYLHLRKATHA